MTPKEQARERKQVAAAIAYIEEMKEFYGQTLGTKPEDPAYNSVLSTLNQLVGAIEKLPENQRGNAFEEVVVRLRKSFEKAAPAISPADLEVDENEVLKNGVRIKINLRK